MSDKAYLQALAKGLGLKSIKPLSCVMGPEELKHTLNGLNMRDFDDGRRLITLHTHSTASDGRIEPADYLDNAERYRQKYGYRDLIVALTDHDTLNGLSIALTSIVQHHDKYQHIRFVLGCELSVMYFDESMRRPMDFEMLHYGINPFDVSYRKWFDDLRSQRQKALPGIFEFFTRRYPTASISLNEFLSRYPQMKRGFGCYLAYITPRYILEKINDPTETEFVWDYFRRLGSPLSENPVLFWHTVDEVVARIQQHGFGFLSVAHPYRIHLEGKINGNGPAFLTHLFTVLKNKGVAGLEVFYANLIPDLDHALDKMMAGGVPTSDTERWVKSVLEFADSHQMIKTGGTDSHTSFLGSRKRALVQELITLWQQYKPLVQEGYRTLNKEMTLGLPAPCMPPTGAYRDTGIGSPWGDGAKRIADFFGGIFDKVQLGPMGRTHAHANYSPYVSDTTPNPFFIPLERLVRQGLISATDLNTAYDIPKQDGQIDFEQVEQTYRHLLHKAWQKDKGHETKQAFIIRKTAEYAQNPPACYIADLQVRIPSDMAKATSDLFLSGYSLGSPADMYSPVARNWHFPVFNPDLLFNQDGSLGPAGRVWYHLIDTALDHAPGGLRIDHYIGFVNPFVISDTNPDDCGRLFSSPNHPVLGRFAKKTPEQFAEITEKIILACVRKHGLSVRDIYAEDVGARPPQLDNVLDRCGLGRLLIAQFAEPTDWTHIYHLKNARPNDVAVLDTHDSPSVQMFFNNLPEDKKTQFAYMLASDLRFNYTDDLRRVEQLIRMQWGALLACPAERVQAFFTSWTGQIGQYNRPGTPDKWHLRCVADFESLYFKNLAQGRAYNPFDAIALAVYARGDAFYQQHQTLVQRLRQAEDEIMTLARQL